MKKKFFRIISTALSWAMLITSVPVSAAPANTHNHAHKVSVNVGESYDLDGAVSDNDAYWTSWNINRAKVTQDGTVTGIRKGKVTVTSRVGLNTDKFTVTVMTPTINLNKKKATIYSGEGTSVSTVKLKATAKGSSKDISWESADSTIATVDSTGLVTAVSPGKVKIYAKANGEQIACDVTVLANSIKLNLDEMFLSTKGNGSSIKLVPTVVGSKKSVKWSTSDKKVATVSGGRVRGRNTGTATITATANGLSVSCNVIVKKNNISINEESLLLYSKESKQLKSNAGKKDVVQWSSSNTDVATVDTKGKVFAVGPGQTTITVSANDTQDNCVVTVKDSKVRIGQDKVELKTKGTDKTWQLGLQVIGRKSTAKWTSSDKKVVTVNSKGKITAKKAGTAIVTATANGVSDTVEIVVKDFEPTVKLNHTDYDLYTGKGNTITLKAKIDGSVKKGVWSSSDPSVATVNNKGKVVAVKPGQTVITVSANDVWDDCIVTVTESKLILGDKTIFLDKGETAELPVDVVGASQSVSYKVSNGKIASIKKGVITAKNYGETDIIVKANGITDVCHVFVDECKHVFGEAVVTKESTCLEEGISTVSCNSCGDILEKTIAKTEHTWVETETKPVTCVTDGTILSKCSVCGETTNTIIPHPGHDYSEWKIVTTPSNFTEGVEKQYCKTCNHENVNIIPPVIHEPWEHVLVDEVVSPTCTEKGYTRHQCECGYFYDDTEVAELGHDYVDGVCSRCGAVQETSKNDVPLTPEILDKIIEDDPVGEIVLPGEFEDEDGEDYTITEIPDYAFKDMSGITGMIIPDTIKKIGKEIFEGCTNLKDVQLPSSVETISDTAFANCDTLVLKYSCTIKASGAPWGATNSVVSHNFGEWETIKDATVEEEGLKRRSCSNCSEEETQTIPKLEHNHQYSTVVTAPTCTEEGYTTYTCECGHSYIDGKIAPLGHNYVDGVCSRCGDEDTSNVLTPDIIDKVIGEDPTGEIVIPDTYEDENGETKEITEIPDGAFAGQTGITSVTIPESVEKIGKDVFEGCTNLVKVVLPDNVTYINPDAFSNCPGLVLYYNCTIKADGATWGAINVVVGHDWSQWTQTKAPTEDEEGVETRTCGHCGEEETRKVPTLQHTHKFNDTVVPATCMKGGYTEHTCECGYSFTDTETSALGHDLSEWSEVAGPTCDLDGSKKRECSRCEYSETEPIEKLGHQYDDIVTPATCEAGGYVTHDCIRCEHSYVDNKTDALGHDFSEWEVTLEATETTEGLMERSCSRCPKTEQQTIPKKDHVHVWSSVVTAPTCTTEGFTTYTCNSCSYSYTDNAVPALGHSYGAASYDWPEDLSQCTASKVCANDSKHVVVETVESTNDVTTDPTCTTDGVRTYTVVFETAGFEQQTQTKPVEALGHDYSGDYVLDVAPTCTDKGEESKYCSRCNERDFVREVDALQHQFGEVTYTWSDDLSSCTASRQCSRDESHKEAETVDATNEVTTEPNCTEKGVRTYTAEFESYSFEQQVRTEDIDALGHDFADEFTVDVQPTCTEVGSKSYHCSRCDAKDSVTEVRELGHSYGEATYVWEDDKSECVATRVCATDKSHVETESVEVTPSITKDPTCTEDGVREFKATFENEAFETQVVTEAISATGHTEVVDAAVEPTCTETGLTEGSHCSVCETVLTKQEVVSAKGHAYANPTYVWTDDKSSCTATVVCGNDNNHVVTETVASVPETTKSPTCLEDGIKQFTATFEKDLFETQVVEVSLDATGHTSVKDPAVAATCENTGLTEGSHCSVCKTVLVEQEILPAKGHAYGEVVYDWSDDLSSCTATRVCSNDNSHVETETANSKPETTKQPTCTDEGVEEFTVEFENTALGKVSQTKPVPSKGHSPVTDPAVEATCTTKGKTEGSHCSVCKVTLVPQEDVPMKQHTPVNAGTKDAHTKCSVCSTVLSTEHTMKRTVDYTATCTKAGKVTYSCECGYSYSTTDELPALGHSYAAPTYEWSADNSECTAIALCVRHDECNHSLTETVESTSVDVKATCTATGTRTYTAEFSKTELGSTTKQVTLNKDADNHTGSIVNGGTSGVHTKYSCCGKTVSATHSYTVDSGVQYSAATCTSKRKNYKSCSCGYNPKLSSQVIEVGSVNPDNHTGEVVNGGTSGVHTKYDCCGKTVSTEHSYTVDSGIQYTAATCIAKRKNYAKCSCGYNPKSASSVVEVGSVNAENHAGKVVSVGSASVCTKYDCCNKTVKSTHNYTADSGVIYYEATCTSPQQNYAKCSVCDYSPKSSEHLVNVGSATGHEAGTEPCTITFNLTSTITSGMGTCRACNCAPYDHTIYVRHSVCDTSVRYEAYACGNSSCNLYGQVTSVIMGELPEGVSLRSILNGTTSVTHAGGTCYNRSCAGLYDAQGNQVISWIDLERQYNVDISKDLTIDNSNPDQTSLYYILNNNSAFSNVTKVVIPNSVTKIGKSAFYSCTGLKSINMPDTITMLGDGVFRGCTGLTEVKLSNTLTEIPNLVFLDCTSLTSVTIPNGVSSIEYRAFSGCTDLTSVTIPDSVTSISSYAFADCTDLTSVTIPNSVTSISVGAFEGCTGLKSVRVPNSVSTISSSTFKNCTSLTNVTLPSSVTSIGDHAFSRCSQLRGIVIPRNVDRIGANAFYSCTSLTNLTIADGVRDIGEYAFYACSGLTTVIIPDSVKYVRNYAFDGCTSITNLTVPVSLQYGVDSFSDGLALSKVILTKGINNGYMYDFTSSNYHNAPWNTARSIGSLSIQSGVKSIGAYAFYRNSNITNLTLPDNVEVVDSYAFYDCPIRTLKAPVSVVYSTDSFSSYTLTTLTLTQGINGGKMYEGGNYPWQIAPTYLEEVTVSSGVTTLSAGVFTYCSNLHYISLPDTLLTIGGSAFRGCRSLGSINLSENLEYIGERAFDDTGITELYLPNSLQEITSSAFLTVSVVNYYCDMPAYLNDSNNGMIELTWGAIDSKLLHYVDWENGYCTYCGKLASGVYDDSGNLLMSWRGIVSKYRIAPSTAYTTSTYATNTSSPYYILTEYFPTATRLIVGEDITTIGTCAFYKCTQLKQLVLPEGLTKVNNNAFNGCTGLEMVSMPANATMTSSAFSAVTNVKKAIITPGTGVMPNYTTDPASYKYTPWFISRATITELVLKEGITTLGNHAFRELSLVESVDIPDTVTTMGSSVFYNWSSLKKVTVPDGVSKLNGSVFSGCTALEELTMPASATIASNSFTGVTNIKKVTLTKGTGTMPNYTTTTYKYTPWYIARDGIEEIYMQDGITTVCNYAFFNCTGLKKLTISDSATSIGTKAINGCSGLTDYTAPCNLLYEDGVAAGCTAIEKVTLTKGTGIMPGFGDICKKTSDNYYYYYYEMTPWYLSKKSVTSITLKDGISDLGQYTFIKCNKVTNFTIPNSVTVIGECTFKWCEGLTSLIIPDSVTEIGASAFCACSKLTNITLPHGITEISKSLFASCSSLTSVVIPNNVTTIGSNAFYNCTSLTSVIIPDNVTTIDDYAFSTCTSLTSVTIPNSVKEIDIGTFYKCTGLTSVTIPNSVTTIGSKAFHECTSLTNLTVPNSVTTIDDYAFKNVPHIYYSGTATGSPWGALAIN